MRELLRNAWRENLGLRISFVFHLVILLGALLAMPFDHRLILGINPWIKPVKFDVSVLIFLTTVAVLLYGLARFPGRFQRSRAIIGWGIGVAMIIEDAVISGQSARGVRSHMNYTTVADALAFSVMGLFIALNTVLLVWLLGLYCAGRTRWPAPVTWGARLGLATIIAGGLEGVLMVQRMGHTVGAKDGLAGLPFVNWSTGHGDLRVAHFFALHALQLMPLLGLALSTTRLPARAQVALVWLGSGVYLGLVWMLFRQAMAGRPLLG